MDVSQKPRLLGPLATALFIYECLRVLLLVVFLYIALPLESGFPEDSTAGKALAFFPYFVYLSANALFPLMALFVWLRPEEYRNYLTLYMAGKIIAVVSFYAWEIFSSREFPGAENVVRSLVLLGGSVFLSLADILSVWGAWTLKKKYRRAEAAAPPAEVSDADYSGGKREGGGW